ncbi:MAG: M3 family metallopeptidase [Deltaproteobacteria bacterium]|nr:M3 family metallopeptidase [Deltaproteobacteria bacterium]
MRMLIVAAVLASAACATPSKEGRNVKTDLSTAADNPLLRPWSGPYGGVPSFDQVKVEHFEPALLGAMDLNRKEIAAIAGDPAAPSFKNTVAAFERSGRRFNDAMAVYGVFVGSLASPQMQAVERAMAPRLAAFSDEVVQNAALFQRLKAVYDAPEKAGLTPEQQRLVWLHYTQFVRAGAALDEAGKKRMAAINERLATLYTSFSQAVLADEEGYSLVLESEADLAGLPDSVRAGFSAAAKAKGLEGKHVVANTRSAVEPFLTYSTRRELREKVWKTFVSRGDNGDAHDTKRLIAEILALRAERAALLGFATHAHWRLENTMAKTPARAMELLEAVWKPAAARVREEVADMQAIADREGASITLAPWDYRFYAEKVRKAKYDLDQNEVKPYLQLEKLREGMFWVAGELFGLEFTPASGVPVFHPDVRVWQVTRKATGQHVGLWYFDPFARPQKRSGAWMDAWRAQERFEGEVPTIVSNNANFVPGRPGEPVLVSWDDATTLFHEFGHALHGLCSNVSYPSLSGTAVARDFVEFPSQILEHWLSTPQVLSRFALHHQSGKPIPPELVAKITRAATFNQGFSTVEYLASALIDMKLHLAGGRPVDPAVFEHETLAALGMPAQIVMRHRTPQFGHVFSSDSYSAGYYSYLWSDTLVADAFEAFTEGKGPYDAEIARRLLEKVLSVGNTVDPEESYRAFRGRSAGIDALMRKRGFAPANK